MNISITDHFRVEDAAELYGLSGWGKGYFAISPDGQLQIRPTRKVGCEIDIHPVIERLRQQGFSTPLLLRFPQALGTQIDELSGAFENAIKEYHYPSTYRPVFPVKVNQQRSVVEGLLEAGRNHSLGLEVGSRPELMLAAALDTPQDALIICNGFKDGEYLSMAGIAASLGKRVIVVIEKPFELDPLLAMVDQGEPLPELGFRLRLQARGSGLWEKSGGFASKFGLTTAELVDCLDRLKARGLLSTVRLLHFHIGSQITEIRKVKAAVEEAARVYARVRQLGAEIQFLDVGGGLGIDYDGSRTSSDASVNYSVQEYANDVVFGISEICEQEGVPHPVIVSESGRMLAAYHSILVVDVRGVISGVERQPPGLVGDEHQIVKDLEEIYQAMTVKNYRETFHDSIEYRDQMQSLFRLGMLGLNDRAVGEQLVSAIANRAVEHSRSAKFIADEFIELAARMQDKYICNFSVFQSLPDHWALDQLFPVMPIHRLDEAPTRRASLVDITCDSDGEIDKFVDPREIKGALDLHPVQPGQPYYLGFMLVGAYQETMGDLHNLFGCVHDFSVSVDGAGEIATTHTTTGETAAETLRCFGYSASELGEKVETQLKTAADTGTISRDLSSALAAQYRRHLALYTYLGK